MPTPHALPIHLSERQNLLLTTIVHASTSPQAEVQRAKIILLSHQGTLNTEIAAELGIGVVAVRKWRKRWYAASLSDREQKLTDKELKATIRQLLADSPRPGTPPTFSAEQVAEIIALACGKPETSGYPVTHWTPELLAIEAVKRKIADTISPSSIRNFLKGSRTSATSGPVLAQPSA